MKAAIQRLFLAGTTRQIEFLPGLNVIRGEIGTGKSTVLRLVYGLFGGGYDDLIPEMSGVAMVEALVLLGDRQYRIARRPVSTLSAKVDIHGDGETARLPAEEGDSPDTETFKQWVQQKLNLPRFDVLPSERLDVDPSPVTVKDYFFYSYLRQTELGSALLGSADRFRGQKRRAVFSAVWGLSSTRYHELESALRLVDRRLFDLRTELRVAEDLFSETEWGNRANLADAIETANASLTAIRETGASAIRVALLRGFASGVSGLPAAAIFEPATAGEDETHVDASRIEILRKHILGLDEAIPLLRDAIDQEAKAASELESLSVQLEAQRKRLTKAAVAQNRLLDYDFLLCPRCGTNLDHERRHREVLDGRCYLCLQIPITREPITPDVIDQEEKRLAAQILESRRLAESHASQIAGISTELAAKRDERTTAAAELDARTRTYVSDAASDLETRAAAEARLRSELEKLREYQRIMDRVDAYRKTESVLINEQDSLERQLKDEESRMRAGEIGMDALDDYFRRAVSALDVPKLDASDYVAIDRDPAYFGPIVWGRRFDQLHSPGAKSLVNVAFAVSNQIASIELQRPLVNILLIDGLTNQIGEDAPDRERKVKVWKYLLDIAETHLESLQIIVADNEVPDFIEPHVRITLSADDRLVPVESGR